MLEFISSACIHNNVRHHTELFEKSNKIKEGKTHSNPATKKFVKPLQLSFCEERGEKFLLEKSPSVQTFFVTFTKHLFKSLRKEKARGRRVDLTNN